MATTVISTLTTTNTTLTTGDEYYLLDGVTHYSNSVVLSSSDTNIGISIWGTLFSTFNTPITMAGNDVRITVGKDGNVRSNEGFWVITLSGDSSALHNAGTIAGGQLELGEQSGTSSTAFLNNSGLMSGIYNGTSALGWIEVNAADTTILNSGEISASQARAIEVRNFGTGLTLTNTGLISGAQDAIHVQSSQVDIGLTIANSGTITAPNRAILGGLDVDVIRSSGEIFGTVETRRGADIVSNSGAVFGSLNLGDGADTYSAQLGGFVSGLIDGESGSDTLVGGSASDVMSGGTEDDKLVGRGGDDDLSGGDGLDMILAGDGNDSVSGGNDNDTITGNGGDDTLFGDDGNDVIVGQDGSDHLDGGIGNDTMDGGAGNDVLEGRAGIDVLRGRGGDDELAGGEGLDFYTGGQGADVFVFRNITHAGIGVQRDQVLDFEQGVDLINVVGMSPGVFEFKGTGAFDTTVPNPELRLFETPTGSTIVQFDVDGDGTPDAEIRVANVTGLTAEDFAL